MKYPNKQITTHALKIIFFILLPAIIICRFSLAAPAGNNIESSEKILLVKEGDTLMKIRSLDGYKKAYLKYKKAFAMAPGDIDLMIKISLAINSWMRVMTNGNQICIDGSTQETEENYKIWGTYGKESESLARYAYNKRPTQTEALIAFGESYMYYSSTFGILKAILVGTVWTYIENGNNMIKLCPTYDYGLGYLCMGVYYMMVPWPLSDMNKAKRHLNKALEISQKSVRNHYYLGLWAMKEEDYALAERELNFVVNNPCTDGSELDFCSFLKSEAGKGLAEINNKQL